jgi:hypothetical protein
MITCESLYEISIKTPSGVRSIPPGTIFESNNNAGILSLLKREKIRIISSSEIHPPLNQSPQSPQCLQNEASKGTPVADIDISKSAMSATIRNEESPLSPLPPAKEIVTGWNQEMRGLIDWFQTAPRLKQPFHLEKHLHVCTPEKFYDSLERSIHAGPSGPRGRHGALMDNLKKLKIVMDGCNTDQCADNLPF